MALSEERSTQLGAGEAKMTTLWHYTINSFWGPRRETPEALAERLNELIERLALIDPVFNNWIWTERRQAVPFAAIRNSLPKKIAAAVSRGDDGEPEPIYGYLFGMFNSLENTPRSLWLSFCVGAATTGIGYSNTVTIKTAWRMEPDPAIVTYPIVRAALLASAECFDVTFGSAYPTAMDEFWPTGLKLHFGWINYVSPRFAPRVTPPKSAIVEYRQNGGLLMSATDETFITSNPHHLAVARDIEAALAPLNALPWPLAEEGQMQ